MFVYFFKQEIFHRRPRLPQSSRLSSIVLYQRISQVYSSKQTVLSQVKLLL